MNSQFFNVTTGPIIECNICFNSGDDHGAELCSGVGAPRSVIHGMVPPGASTALEHFL